LPAGYVPHNTGKCCINNFIGNPKQPTISVCNLIDEEYQISKFRDHERIISQTFPELDLTVNQIFKAYI
jgi:Uma2 family endonuclease